MGGILPGSTSRAVLSTPFVVTLNGTSGDTFVKGLDITSSGAQLILNYSSTSFGLNLGTATSSWTAGNVDVRTSWGIYGNGSGSTTLNLSAGVELLYSTTTATRFLNSLTLSNAGTLHATTGVLQLSNDAITNQSGGLIHADGAEIDIQNGTTLVNLGTLRATGSSGKLFLNGTITTANLGVVDLVSGGHVYLAGTINNASSTLNAPSGGTYELNGGTITGGTISANALTLANSGTLNGATLQGDFNVTGPQTLVLLNGAGIAGNTTVNGSLYLGSDLTMLVGSTIVVTGSGSYLTYSGSPVRTLTIPATATLTRSGAGYTYLYTNLVNQGNVSATNGTLYGNADVTNNATFSVSGGAQYYQNTSNSFTNASGATASVSGSSSVLRLSNLNNLGTLSASSAGTLQIAGNTTTARLGAIDLSNGGAAEILGTLDNTSTNLTAPTSGVYVLKGTIVGGTISETALSQYSGILDGATITGNVTIGGPVSLSLQNGAGFTGTATVAGALYLGSDLALLANSTLSLTASGSYLTYSGGTVRTLTIPATATLSRSGSGYTYDYTNLDNHGTVSISGGTLYGNANATNSGTFAVSGGGAYSQSGSTTFTNTTGATASVSGSGSVLHINSPVNTGTLSASNNGVLQIAGNTTTANLGSISISTGGTAELIGTLDNTLSLLVAPLVLKGTIIGGNVSESALTMSSGALDGATVLGNITVGSSDSLTLKNGAGFTGNATVSGVLMLGSDLSLLANSNLIYSGNGAYLTYSGGTVRTLTIPATSSLTQSNSGYTYQYVNLLNQGTVTINGGTIYGNGNVTNNANFAVTGGGQYNQSTAQSFSNANGATASVTGSGSILQISNPTNSGTLSASSSGVLQLNGNYTTAQIGTVTLTTGASAELMGNVTNTGATLNAPSGGTYVLKGTIIGGNVSETALTHASGTLDGATILGNTTVASSTSLRLQNGAGFTGNATVSGVLTLGSDLSLLANSNLIYSGNGAYLTYSGGTVRTLTIPATSSLTQSSSGYTYQYVNLLNQGTVTINGGTIYGNGNVTNNATFAVTGGGQYNQSTAQSFSNANGATASVTGSGSILQISNPTNAGTLSASSSGVLQLNGNYTTAQIGTVTLATGASAELMGNVTNTGATLNAPSGGTYVLKGTIIGGNVSETALTHASGTLDGATILGNTTVGSSASLRLQNGAGFTGNAAVSGTLTLGSNLSLLANSSLVFSGTGSSLTYSGGTVRTLTIPATASLVRLTGGYSYDYADLLNQGTVSINSGTIYGNSNVTNQGTFAVSGGGQYSQSTSYTFTNNTGATASVAGSGSVLHLTNIANTGTLQASLSGVIQLDGTFGTPAIGNVDVSNGGAAEIVGTLNNAGNTLAAPTGGSFTLRGTINGGSVASNALIASPFGGTLSGVTLLGSMNFPASSIATLTNGTNFGGGAGTISLGASAIVLWQQVGTVSSKTLTFSNGAIFDVVGGNNSVTLASDTTASGNIQFHTDFSTGTSITNLGTITNTSSSGSVYALSVANNGTIAATAGTLTLGTTATGATFTNNSGAIIRANGGNIVLSVPLANPLVNLGQIDIQSGTFFTNNRLTNGSTGLISGAGVLSGNMIMSGGTIAPGNGGIGSLTFISGTLTVAGASTFAVDLGGASSDSLIFQNPTAVVNIGSGLLSLSLNLLSAPTANTTYSLISITSGGSGISGSFAGLLNSGNTLTASFGGNPYTFAVNYQSNLVSLTYNPILVPEPSTYALVGLGMLTLFVLYRRQGRDA